MSAMSSLISSIARLHRQAGANGALGVVLVGDRRAEDRHHVVADVLVDPAAVADDLLAEAAQRAVDHGLDGLGIHPLGDRRVAGEVGEDHGRLAALLRRRGGHAARREVGPGVRSGGGAARIWGPPGVGAPSGWCRTRMQNLAPGGFSAPQLGQRGASAVPHDMQKRARSGFAVPQLGQSTSPATWPKIRGGAGRYVRSITLAGGGWSYSIGMSWTRGPASALVALGPLEVVVDQRAEGQQQLALKTTTARAARARRWRAARRRGGRPGTTRRTGGPRSCAAWSRIASKLPPQGLGGQAHPVVRGPGRPSNRGRRSVGACSLMHSLERHQQRAVLELRPRRAPAGERRGEDDRPLLAPGRDDQLLVDLLHETSSRSANGTATRSVVVPLSEVISRARPGCMTAAGSASANSSRAELVEHRRPDHLLGEVVRGEDRHRREAVADLGQPLALARLPLAEVAAGELLREDPVDDHGIGHVAVEVEVGEGPLRLLDHHPVGVHHQPDRGVLAVAEDLVHRDQVADQALDLGEDVLAWAASRRARCARAASRRPTMRRSHGSTLSSHQRAMSGNESRRSVSPVGAQSTMITSNSPESWWRLICSRLKSSSMPGRDGQLLGGDVHHAAVGEQLAQPALDRAPVGLHLALRLDLLAPQAVAERGRVGAQVGLERVGQAVRGVGREDDRAQAGGGAAAGGGGGDAGLADASLARVEDGSGGHQGGAGYRTPLAELTEHPWSAAFDSLRCAPISEIYDWSLP